MTELQYINKHKDIYRYILDNSMLIKEDTNFLLLPKVQYEAKDENALLFSQCWQFIANYPHIRQIVRTASGGVSISGARKYWNCYDFRMLSYMAELTIILYAADGRHGVRLQFGRERESTTYSGRKALAGFKQECEALGIDLSKYAVENGKEVKASIPKPRIWLNESLKDRTIEHAYHIDYHSSHDAGMANAYPELRPIFEKWYQQRKKSKTAKAKLVMCWGALQAKMLCGAKYALIAKAGIEDTNRRVDNMVKKLEAIGYTIIALNTDGIFYYSPTGELGEYHGEGEGKALGQWSNDIEDVTIRFKSKGAYEYITRTGEYKAVLRGRTLLDAEKDRSLWQWGDIYDDRAEYITYRPDYDTHTLIKEVITRNE